MTIASNEQVTSELATTLKESLAGYNGFRLQEFSGSAPVSGNATHDSIGSSVTNALDAWEKLVVSDATAIQQTGFQLGTLDTDIAKALLGVGGGGQ